MAIHGPYDGFLAVLVRQQPLVESADVEHLAVIRRQTAQPHHPVVLRNPPIQLAELPNQIGVEHGHAAEVQHQSVGKVLLQQGPQMLGKRNRVRSYTIVSDACQEPIRTTFHVQLSRARLSASRYLERLQPAQETNSC